MTTVTNTICDVCKVTLNATIYEHRVLNPRSLAGTYLKNKEGEYLHACSLDHANQLAHKYTLNYNLNDSIATYKIKYYEELAKSRKVYVVVSKHGEWAGAFSTYDAAKLNIESKGKYTDIYTCNKYNATRTVFQAVDGHQYYIYTLEVKN